MSQAVKVAMLATKDLDKNTRMVALAIAAHANAAGDAWPSVATLADYVGCSERTVQRAIVKLTNLGRLIVRKVATIATRVYRLVTGQPERPGVTDQALGVTDSPAGGDSQSVTRSDEDHLKEKPRASARDWRRFIPKTKNQTAPTRTSYPYAERRGAALPPVSGVAQCARHRGSPAHNCGPCRAESLGGN